jgi:RNA polymerase sigma-70 factor (ECF subfamily)
VGKEAIELERDKVEAELVKKAQEGVKEAFEQLCLSVMDSVYGYLFSKLKRDHNVTQDLISEVFLRVMDRLLSFRMESSFKTWVIGIARNVFREYLKAEQRRVRTELTVAWEDVDQQTLEQMKLQYHEALENERSFRAEEYAILRRAMGTLSDEQQEILLLRIVNELTVKEVAATLNKSEASIRNLQYRANIKIKEFFARSMKEKRG